MARIRTIKPEFWASPEAMAMSRDARLLALGLISAADDHGRFLASVAALIGAVFPNDPDVTPAKLARWLEEVEATGMIELYQVRGVRYGHFPSWLKHQKVARPTPSRIPDPPHDNRTTDAHQLQDTLNASSVGFPEDALPGSARVKDLGSRILDQGSKDQPPLAPLGDPPPETPTMRRGTRIPGDFVPNPESRSAILTDFPALNLAFEHAKFVDYWTAKPGKDGVKLDWQATWRNWMRKAGQDLRRSTPDRRQQATDDQFARAMARAEAREAAKTTTPVTIRGELS